MAADDTFTLDLDDPQPAEWVGFFDPTGEWFHFQTCEQPGTHWTMPVVDEAISDPEGNFLVFVSHREFGDDHPRVDVRISIRCAPGPRGYPIVLHEAFDSMVFGSPTLRWSELKRVSWWWTIDPWGGQRPTAWAGSSGSWLGEIYGDRSEGEDDDLGLDAPDLFD